MKNVLIGSFILGFYLLFANTTFAAGTATTECQPIYGGGISCPQVGNIIVDKTVKNPKTGNFVNNLDVNDPKFSPDETARFRITVTNNGDANISNINVKDIFPEFVNFLAGAGKFDSNTKTLSFTIDNLNKGESKTFDITGKIVPVNQLPTDRGVICVINQGVATSSNTGQTSQDNSQLCIEKKILAETTKGGLKVLPAPQVTTTPATGPEMLSLIGLIPTGIAGLILRRKTKRVSEEKSA